MSAKEEAARIIGYAADGESQPRYDFAEKKLTELLEARDKEIKDMSIILSSHEGTIQNLTERVKKSCCVCDDGCKHGSDGIHRWCHDHHPWGGKTVTDLTQKVKELEGLTDGLAKSLSEKNSLAIDRDAEITRLKAELAEAKSVSRACDILWDECVRQGAKQFGEWDCVVDGKKFQVRIQLDTIPTYAELESQLSQCVEALKEMKEAATSYLCEQTTDSHFDAEQRVWSARDKADKILASPSLEKIARIREIEKNLLNALIWKRKYDGLNGRTWDAQEHLNAETEVAKHLANLEEAKGG